MNTIWKKDVNLITGAPDLYHYQRAEDAQHAYPKKLVSFLLAMLIAETVAIGYYAYVNGPSFTFIPNSTIAALVSSIPRLSFTEFDLFRAKSSQILGAATHSAGPDRLESAENVSAASVSASTTPEPTEVPSPTIIPTPKPDMTIYTVKNGDNWWQIVKKTCGTVELMGDLVNFNQEQNLPTLHRGDNVKVYCMIP